MAKKSIKKQFDLLNPDVPLVFADGIAIYNKLKKEYVTHKLGFFVLAPSGAGKTHYIKNQKEAHWIDGDEVWMMARAHPDGAWWLESISVIDEIDARSDVVTMEAKKLGFWIMGASNNWLKPDAVVIPDWRIHQKWIAYREKHNYDGGATSEHLEQVKKSRIWMSRWKKSGVPSFKTVEEATEYLENKIK